MIFTQFGKDALTAVMAGDTTITFTTIVASNSKDIIIVDGYKEIKYPIKETEPSAMKFDKNTSTAIITGIFDNQSGGVDGAIFMVGLYATCAGALTRDTPTLFCYEQFSTGEPLPPFSEGYATRSYSFNTKVADATHVQITMQDGAYALSVDLADLQDTVEEYRLESGIVEATHSKRGNNHYLTVNNAAKNIRFKATDIFDYNDVFYVNNTLYEATTISGNALAPGYFNTGQTVMAFVDNSAHKLVFNDADRIGMMVINSGTLIDYVDALPLGYYTLWYPYTNTDDPLRPSSRDMYVEVYKPSVNTINILAHVFNPSDPHDYKTCKINGSWSVVWQEY